MFELAAGTPLLERMSSAQRAERVAAADRLVAVGEFTRQRIEDTTDEDNFWCVDEWEKIAAEVGAELGISRGRVLADALRAASGGAFSQVAGGVRRR